MEVCIYNLTLITDIRIALGVLKTIQVVNIIQRFLLDWAKKTAKSSVNKLRDQEHP